MVECPWELSKVGPPSCDLTESKMEGFGIAPSPLSNRDPRVGESPGQIVPSQTSGDCPGAGSGHIRSCLEFSPIGPEEEIGAPLRTRARMLRMVLTNSRSPAGASIQGLWALLMARLRPHQSKTNPHAEVLANCLKGEPSEKQRQGMLALTWRTIQRQDANWADFNRSSVAMQEFLAPAPRPSFALDGDGFAPLRAQWGGFTQQADANEFLQRSHPHHIDASWERRLLTQEIVQVVDSGSKAMPPTVCAPAVKSLLMRCLICSCTGVITVV